MYSQRKLRQQKLEGDVKAFNMKLNPENRWIKMNRLIPWEEIEAQYAQNFNHERKDGRRAITAREALGALLVQQIMQLSDRETVTIIQENPYIQYFLGYQQFRLEKPFDASTMVHFRKRFSVERIAQINEMLYNKMTQKPPNPDTGKEHQETPDQNQTKTSPGTKETPKEAPTETPRENKGKLLLDATCIPSDIRYPTDLSLLNESREKLEKQIDILWAELREKGSVKPRTYRKEARKAYLAKAKKPGRKGIRKAIKAQLQYVERDLNILNRLIQQGREKGIPNPLTEKEIEELETIRLLFAQQQEMYKNKTHRAKDRIVSIWQSWVRPIVRGKTKTPVEFGAKLEISIVNGFTAIEKISWDNFNESTGLRASVERYKAKYGCYPEAVLADKLYRNRKNLAYCKERGNLKNEFLGTFSKKVHGIRLSGPRLGRPPKDEKKNKAHKKLEHQDTCERNAVEGKFGEGKRTYGLERIKTKLKETSETVIGLNILAMNLMSYYRRSLDFLFIFFILAKISRIFAFRRKISSRTFWIARNC